MLRVAVLFLVFACGVHTVVYSQTTGDNAIAERFVLWAQNAIAEERWAEALAALERGADFADASSDVSYLLAYVSMRENRPRDRIFETLRYSLVTDRWNLYSADDARTLLAQALIESLRYNDALRELALVPVNIETISLRLRALRWLDDRERFAETLDVAMNRFPRDPQPVRIFFEYMADKVPMGNELGLMTIALRRLPVLMQSDNELAFLAIPFMSDVEEARRRLAAFRALNFGVHETIPHALNLGLIDGNTAIDELFYSNSNKISTLDRDLIQRVWSLLRDQEERNRFSEYISTFTGVIIEDTLGKGFPEIQVFYESGVITKYTYDGNRNRLPEMTIFFSAGVPVSMTANGVTLRWEQYPAVLETTLNGTLYRPVPFDFFFLPVYFMRLESGGILYPERNPFIAVLSPYTLTASSLYIERPSSEFSGAVERVEFSRGIPQRAQEFLNGRLVSETEFLMGRAVSQRLDLNGDGVLETVRHFKWVETAASLDPERILRFAESDLHRTGAFGYREQYIYDEDLASYRTVRFWDMGTGGIIEIIDDQVRYIKN